MAAKPLGKSTKEARTPFNLDITHHPPSPPTRLLILPAQLARRIIYSLIAEQNVKITTVARMGY